MRNKVKIAITAIVSIILLLFLAASVYGDVPRPTTYLPEWLDLRWVWSWAWIPVFSLSLFNVILSWRIDTNKLCKYALRILSILALVFTVLLLLLIIMLRVVGMGI